MSEKIESSRPRYFRLLEKGERVKDGDVTANSTNLQPCGLVSPVECLKVFRPVQVDEWIPYAERKPTKEDFQPTGSVLVFSRGSAYRYGSTPETAPSYWHNVSYWRRITPPEQPEPKSVKLKFIAGKTVDATPNPDGSTTLGCGDKINAESIDEFIKVRESVMSK
jgi:hypothetical protein